MNREHNFNKSNISSVLIFIIIKYYCIIKKSKNDIKQNNFLKLNLKNIFFLFNISRLLIGKFLFQNI